MIADTDILSDFMQGLTDGSIDIVDLTHPLGPETPMIKVPKGHGK